MYKVISFGYRCSSAGFVQKLNLKTESYPFDWLISNLNVVKDCIETNFVHFLNINNYNIDGYINNEYYQRDPYRFSFMHYNISKYYDYYQRCAIRLLELLKTDIPKYYLYFHPIMEMNDFQKNRDDILNEFDDFNQYIAKKTKNIFGIYFILVKYNNEGIKSIKLKETSTHNIVVLYCNDHFIDTGIPFDGNSTKEEEELTTILRNILPTNLSK